MFEQPVCAACDELHQDILQREPVSFALSNFDGVILDTWSDAPIQTPTGEETTIRDWAASSASSTRRAWCFSITSVERSSAPRRI